MTHFFLATVVLKWLSSSLLPCNGMSSLLSLTTLCVCDIRLSDVVMSLNILFGCSQTMNACNVVTNFSHLSTIHIMHLVACQTPHLLFCCSLSDQPPNESPEWLKLLTSVTVPYITILAMDASMRDFFVISGEILDSRSECSFFLACYLLFSFPMACWSSAERISFQCSPAESSFHLWYG